MLLNVVLLSLLIKSSSIGCGLILTVACDLIASMCVCCAICESFPFDGHECLLDYCHMVLVEALVYFFVPLHNLEFISF
jgi:hypothetical protein